MAVYQRPGVPSPLCPFPPLLCVCLGGCLSVFRMSSVYICLSQRWQGIGSGLHILSALQSCLLKMARMPTAPDPTPACVWCYGSRPRKEWPFVCSPPGRGKASTLFLARDAPWLLMARPGRGGLAQLSKSITKQQVPLYLIIQGLLLKNLL